MWENLTRVLNDLGEEIIKVYQYKLQENEVNASHILSSTLDYLVDVNGNVFDVYVDLQPYWYYVEYGREKGKWANVDSIREWIKVKPVIPYKTGGKLPTLNQLTYLIGRSIKEKGIRGKHLLFNSVDEVWDAYELEMEDAIEKDMIKIIENNLVI